VVPFYGYSKEDFKLGIETSKDSEVPIICEVKPSEAGPNIFLLRKAVAKSFIYFFLEATGLSICRTPHHYKSS
jgi:hypothetical protein